MLLRRLGRRWALVHANLVQGGNSPITGDERELHEERFDGEILRLSPPLSRLGDFEILEKGFGRTSLSSVDVRPGDFWGSLATSPVPSRISNSPSKGSTAVRRDIRKRGRNSGRTRIVLVEAHVAREFEHLEEKKLQGPGRLFPLRVSARELGGWGAGLFLELQQWPGRIANLKVCRVVVIKSQ